MCLQNQNHPLSQSTYIYIYIYIYRAPAPPPKPRPPTPAERGLKEGIEEGLRITYSSLDWNPGCKEKENFKVTAGQNVGWCPRRSSRGQWVQIDADHEVLWKEVATKGVYKNYVKNYYIKYSNDGTTWKQLGGMWTANSDPINLKTNVFNPPIKAKMIRIVLS